MPGRPMPFPPRPRWRPRFARADSSSLRKFTATRAPSAARPRAMARPMPRPPPVTIAARPERLIGAVPFVGVKAGVICQQSRTSFDRMARPGGQRDSGLPNHELAPMLRRWDRFPVNGASLGEALGARPRDRRRRIMVQLTVDDHTHRRGEERSRAR